MLFTGLKICANRSKLSYPVRTHGPQNTPTFLRQKTFFFQPNSWWISWSYPYRHQLFNFEEEHIAQTSGTVLSRSPSPRKTFPLNSGMTQQDMKLHWDFTLLIDEDGSGDFSLEPPENLPREVSASTPIQLSTQSNPNIVPVSLFLLLSKANHKSRKQNPQTPFVRRKWNTWSSSSGWDFLDTIFYSFINQLPII